jgi:hypothetical protein
VGPTDAGTDSPDRQGPDGGDSDIGSGNNEGVAAYELAEDLPTMPPGPLQRKAALRWAELGSIGPGSVDQRVAGPATASPAAPSPAAPSPAAPSPAGTGQDIPGHALTGPAVPGRAVARPTSGDLPVRAPGRPIPSVYPLGSADQLAVEHHLQGPPTLRLRRPAHMPTRLGAPTTGGASIEGAGIEGAGIEGAGIEGAGIEGAAPGHASPGRASPGRASPGRASLGRASLERADPAQEVAAGRASAGPWWRRRRAVLVLLVVALVATLAAIGLALGDKGTRLHQSQAPHVSPGQATFAMLLATSANAHDLVVDAVNGPCQASAPASASRQTLIGKLNRAIELQVSVLDRTQMDKVAMAAMPEGTLLMTELAQATDASLKVDEDYGAWLVDLQATGCFSAPTNNLYYLAATEALPAAARADRSLASTWAPLASRAHLRSWDADQL